MPASQPTLTFYCDGACSGNPGPGGWGVFGQLPSAPQPLRLWGSNPHTTNNQMELLATIKSLEAFAPFAATHHCAIFTDSLYVVKGINEWRPGWTTKGWLTPASTKLKNASLWLRLFALVDQLHPTVAWVKGHATHGPHRLGNDQADALACLGKASCSLPSYHRST